MRSMDEREFRYLETILIPRDSSISYDTDSFVDLFETEGNAVYGYYCTDPENRFHSSAVCLAKGETVRIRYSCDGYKTTFCEGVRGYEFRWPRLIKK